MPRNAPRQAGCAAERFDAGSARLGNRSRLTLKIRGARSGVRCSASLGGPTAADPPAAPAEDEGRRRREPMTSACRARIAPASTVRPGADDAGAGAVAFRRRRGPSHPEPPNDQAQRTRTAERAMIAQKMPRRCGVRCSGEVRRSGEVASR